jgi:hypothetical protein
MLNHTTLNTLRQLRLPGMAQALEEQLTQPPAQALAFEADTGSNLDNYQFSQLIPITVNITLTNHLLLRVIGRIERVGYDNVIGIKTNDEVFGIRRPNELVMIFAISPRTLPVFHPDPPGRTEHILNFSLSCLAYTDIGYVGLGKLLPHCHAG